MCFLFRHTVTEVFNLYQRTRNGGCVFHRIRIVSQNSFKKWDSCHTRLSVDKSMSHYWRAWMTLQVQVLSDIKVYEKQAYSSRANRIFNWLLNTTFFFYITAVFHCQNMLRQCFQFKPNHMSETKQKFKIPKWRKRKFGQMKSGARKFGSLRDDLFSFFILLAKGWWEFS